MQDSSEWLRYFRGNLVVTVVALPWEAGFRLPAAERRALAASLRGFQAGESSDGRRLLAYGERYADRTGDRDYLAALRLFIAEEHRHARDLGRFLTLNDVPLVKTNPLDRVFRVLRHLVGTLEIALTVLIAAEIIAEVYYAAIGRATRLKLLRALCAQILKDEEQHVVFQAEQLGRLRAWRGRGAYVATLGLQRVLFAGTCVAVWLVHGRAMRTGGETAAGFWRHAWERFARAADISDSAREQIRREASRPWRSQQPSTAG